MADLTIDEINHLDEAAFVDELDDIYEHSPWVAERVRSERPFASLAELRDAMKHAVDDASREKKLELLRAHPDLGDQTRITESSAEEQAAAGLDQLSPEMYEAFQRLNERYLETFGFPFIMAVRDESPETIREAMERRVEHSEADEFRTALAEVHTIARFRLEDRFPT
ncbi:2-oxo-4-hydroxy-4-carboxy-5-ureidoimidazoline decarboxylase [Natrinema versiforme]|uniref:2-oxo-4-hydroxy-4-carboxy-5-ureidoimidazoline decarboxylase n=1 Tax=Natrinema versiforme TaxID=88724 RepID=A0A4P8WNL5_9EURY|nr:2-oxo-4-hydroxy-4-carboxy-5-ureidoimidazoline decarboxylase [Natrinema versiforme]QCS45090.1 2-oxo-4-hydroxy-4-carboxy-5-ureidoimidazoline decarboxylase [Natrinema versiforme]